jgi:hypothetical protein
LRFRLIGSRNVERRLAYALPGLVKEVRPRRRRLEEVAEGVPHVVEHVGAPAPEFFLVYVHGRAHGSLRGEGVEHSYFYIAEILSPQFAIREKGMVCENAMFVALPLCVIAPIRFRAAILFLEENAGHPVRQVLDGEETIRPDDRTLAPFLLAVLRLVPIGRDRKCAASELLYHLVFVPESVALRLGFDGEVDSRGDRTAHEVMLPFLAASDGTVLAKEASVLEQTFPAWGHVNDHVIALGTERSTALLRWVKEQWAAVIGVLELAQEFDTLEERAVALIERGEDFEHGRDGLGTEAMRHLQDGEVSDLPRDVLAAWRCDVPRAEGAFRVHARSNRRPSCK